MQQIADHRLRLACCRIQSIDHAFGVLPTARTGALSMLASPSESLLEPGSADDAMLLRGDADGAGMLGLLPPPPQPNVSTMRMEAALGCAVRRRGRSPRCHDIMVMLTPPCSPPLPWNAFDSIIPAKADRSHRLRSQVVGAITAGLVTVVRASASLLGPPGSAAVAAAHWLIYLQAGLALVCLAGLMLGDPGVVQRTAATQLPVPEEVAARVEAGQGLEGIANLKHPMHGSYCIRCCVWRPTVEASRAARAERVAAAPAWARWSLRCWLGPTAGGSTPGVHQKQPHHCSVCQRCVLGFDHHCGVFGRCIAGEGASGNLR